MNRVCVSRAAIKKRRVWRGGSVGSLIQFATGPQREKTNQTNETKPHRWAIYVMSTPRWCPQERAFAKIQSSVFGKCYQIGRPPRPWERCRAKIAKIFWSPRRTRMRGRDVERNSTSIFVVVVVPAQRRRRGLCRRRARRIAAAPRMDGRNVKLHPLRAAHARYKKKLP